MNAIHEARPLTSDEQQIAYAEALSFYGTKRELNKKMSRLGWIVGITGLFCSTASVVGWCFILPMKTVEVQFVEVDHSTGIIAYGAGPNDAPALFGQREAEHFMQQYIEAREGYVPELDPRKWQIVTEMSSTDVGQEYVAWRKSDLSPVKQLGTAGRVEVTDFMFTPHGKGKNDTFEYTVRFNRREFRAETIGPKKAVSNTIDFQWHPKAAMTPQEAHDNPGGMVVIAYTPPENDR